jgi:septal ring-binding cell division protein DamX
MRPTLLFVAVSLSASALTASALAQSQTAAKGKTTDVRRVGQANGSTLDRPAPHDPRVHQPTKKPAWLNTWQQPKPTATPKPVENKPRP